MGLKSQKYDTPKKGQKWGRFVKVLQYLLLNFYKTISFLCGNINQTQ
jgi:hypothetical protein